MADHKGEALARRLIPLDDGTRIVALDSATFVEGFYDGKPSTGRDIIVNASYSGVFCAKLVMAHRPRAAIGLDCAIGKDGAGISGLWYYEALNIPAAAAGVMTAEMGNGLDLHDNGVISRVNSPAEDAGVKPGMRVPEAAKIIGRPVKPVTGVRTNRVVIKTSATGRSIVCTDSIPYALPEDIGRNVLCVGGHTGVSIIGYLKHFRPWGFLMSDGGMGKNRSGVAAMEPLSAAGLPGASVSAMTARMGDGRSTYFDGVVSACNTLAKIKGVRVGQTAIAAAECLLQE
jgi:hypothetical protein